MTNIKKHFRFLVIFSLLISLLIGQTSISVANVVDEEVNEIIKNSPFHDIKGHWAEEVLLRWLNNGFVSGYENGTFKPDKTITRGEFMALINRSFGFTEEANLSFTDLTSADWVYVEVAKATAVGYMKGYEDGTIRADAPITRQEVAVVIARLLRLDGTPYIKLVNEFLDASDIPDWSEEAVAAALHAGLLKGYEDGTFKPNTHITRAESVVALNRSVIVRYEVIYDQAGTYGPLNGVEIVGRDVIVNAPGVTLQNMNILGNLRFTDGIGADDIYLENVTVEGTTIASSEGMTLHLDENTSLANLVLDRITHMRGSGQYDGVNVNEDAEGSTFEQDAEASDQNTPIFVPQPSTPTETEPPAPEPRQFIVSEGVANAVIVKPSESNAEINEAAAVIKEYIERSTGVGLAIHTVDQLDGLVLGEETVLIRVGEGAYSENEELSNDLESLHADGFVIFPNASDLIIAASTPVGTRNGAYAFLEKYVGVTWLFPGEEWTDVPVLNELLMPNEKWKNEPNSFSMLRTLNMGSGLLYGDIRHSWQRQNRVISAEEIKRGHNIYTIFPIEKYGDPSKYPNFYPNNNPPEAGVRIGWQPCYSNPATVVEAVKHIKEYFSKNPKEVSFSLAVNDVHGFCEQDPLHEFYPNKTNSVGRQHMSEIYYKWVNDVVEEVLAEYQEKWFTVYAYDEVMDPPNFDLNPKVIPIITKDRLTWIDPDVRSRGEQHLEAWADKAANLGWYDYMLSYAYPLPRVYPNFVAELYEYALDRDVLVHHWDMHPVLGDGPQPWIIAKLGWSMDMDVEVLLDHWYEAAVGSESALYLREYFELWEEFWHTKAKESPWFSTSKNQTYLSVRNNSYLALAKEEVLLSRQLLETVVEKTSTPEQKIRAQQLLHQFEYYEISALSYPGKLATPRNDEDVLKLLQELEENLEDRLKMFERRAELIDEYNKNLTQAYPRDPMDYTETWSGWNPDEFWHIYRYIDACQDCDESSEIKQKLSSFARNIKQPMLNEFAQLLEQINIDHSLAKDADFEEDTMSAWSIWDPPGSAIVEKSSNESMSGGKSIRFENATRAGVYQIVDVEPGLLASSVKFFTEKNTTSRGTIQIVVELHSEQDKLVYFSETKTLAEHAGQWAEVVFFEEMPAQINGQDIQNILINIQVNNADDTILYLDDIGVYQVEKDIDELSSIIYYLIEENVLTESQADEILTLIESAKDKLQAGDINLYLNLLTNILAEASRLWDVNLLTESDYEFLTSKINGLINQYVSFHAPEGKFKVLGHGYDLIPVTINNHHSESLSFQISGNSTYGVTIGFDNPVTVPSKGSVVVEGTVTIDPSVQEDDYVVDLGLDINNNRLLNKQITLSYASNLVANPGFEDGNTAPDFWSPLSQTIWEWDQNEVHSGQYSLKLYPGESGRADMTSSQIPVTTGKTYRLTFWHKNSATNGGNVKIRNIDEFGKTVDYISIAVQQDTDWTEETFTFEIDESTHFIQIYLLMPLHGDGPIWFDDIRVDEQVIPSYNSNLVVNPGFEDGNTAPDFWSPLSQTIWEWDQDEVHSGQYSLKLYPGESGRADMTSSQIPVTTGKTYRLTFWHKNSATNGGNVKIRNIDEFEKTVNYISIAVQQDTDWTEETFTFEIDDSTHSIQIYLLMPLHGDGPIWFDDIKVEEVPMN